MNVKSFSFQFSENEFFFKKLHFFHFF